MNHRPLSMIAIVAILITVGALLPVASQTTATKGQAPKTPVAKTATSTNKPATSHSWKTSWGDPDLQGVWNDATSTPLERPGGVGSKDILTDEEAGEFQQQLAHDLSRDRRDGGAAVDVNRAYNEHWMDARRLKI